MSNKNNILKTVHQTAKDLHTAGAFSRITMRKFDQLCLEPIHQLKPGEIKHIREIAHLSQAVFAAYLNISVSTVQKWEMGDKKPSGTAMKLLNLIQERGIQILLTSS